jgi:hypothetical protein
MSISRAGLAGLLISLLAVPVAGADVTVRVEGSDDTLVRQVSVPRIGPDVQKGGGTCRGDSASGALERATDGDWTGTNFEFGVSVDSIMGENHLFDSGTFWGFDVGNRFADTGPCDYILTDGDEILFYAACGAPDASGCFDGRPLDVVAPPAAPTGKPFLVRVDQYDDTTGTPSPAVGATIVGGDDIVTTGADGTAEVTLSDKGRTELIAVLGNQVRDEAIVDAGGGEYALLTDTKAPRSRVLRIRNGATLSKGPRFLRARVSEAGVLRQVFIGLTRKVGKSCSAFSDARSRFVKSKCRRRPSFGIVSGKRVSYLLPERLGPGRYIFDVRAVDRAGNRERLARGRNRVVFRVS